MSILFKSFWRFSARAGLLLLGLYTSPAFSTVYGWYSDKASAQSACYSQFGSNNCYINNSDHFGDNSSICAGSSGAYGKVWNFFQQDFFYCQSGYASCPVTGAVRGTDGNCSCTGGRTEINGACECPINTYWNSGLNQCSPIVICNPPETDDGYGHCVVSECTGGQVLNPFAGGCADEPSCSAYEHTDWTTDPPSCVLNPLWCPENSHANSLNDACLPDPPIACDEGMHDDGTYHCVADDAKGCHGNTKGGYVNGQLVCVQRVNHDDNIESGRTKASEAADAAADADVAIQTCDIARSAYNADPTPEKLAAMDSLCVEADRAVSRANQKQNESVARSAAETVEQLDDIRHSLSDDPLNDPDIASEGNVSMTPQAAPVPDYAEVAGFASNGMCPAPKQYTVKGHLGLFKMDTACEFILQLRPIILLVAWLGALFIAGSDVYGNR